MTVRDERDTWLAGLARAGNGRARDELLASHWRLLYHIVGCGLLDQADVDHALSALAERLRHTAPDSEPVRGWFAAEARRLVRSRRRPGRAGSDGPDFVATAVAGLGLTGQAQHLVEALRWLAPHDRDTFALWWLAETGELTAAEVEAASGHSPSEADDRVRRMAPRLDAARLVVAALAAEPVCGDLALLAGGTARHPQPHRRSRVAAHVSECARCVTELEPIGPLLGSLGLVPAPAVPPPAPRGTASSRSSVAPSVDAPTRRRNTIWRRLARSRGTAAPSAGSPAPIDAAAPPAAGRPEAGQRGVGGAPDAAGPVDRAARRGAAGSERYSGRRGSAAGWSDLAMSGADLADPPAFASGPAVRDDSTAAPLDAATASRGSAMGSAMGAASVRRPANPGGSAGAGLRRRQAFLVTAGAHLWTSVRGLVSGAADIASAFRYRGRRFKSDGLPRRAILVALLIAMLVVVGVVANGTTRSAAPVHNPGPVTTTAAAEPSPAAVTTAPATPPAKGIAPPARAVAPDRTPVAGPTSAAAPTTPRPPVTTSYEAEAARFIGASEVMIMPEASGGRIVHKLGTGNNPYGYTERGAIEFTVNAPSARRYTLTVYYVDGDRQRTAYARLNGGQWQAWSFQPGGWGRVMSATFPLDLRAGANSLYFHNPADWMPRLDRITITG
jgi:hypothetical protein